MTAIVLPWPDADLNPNARVHRMQLVATRRAARFEGKVEAMSQVKPAERSAFRAAGALVVVMTFHPPNKRGWNDDNMIASMKAARDGIADALGVDDAHWRVTYAIGAPVKGGRVVVEVTAASPAEVG